MELLHLELEKLDKGYDYKVECAFKLYGEDFRAECFIDVETFEEDEDQSNEEIEVQGKRTKEVIEDITFCNLQTFDESNIKINLSIDIEDSLKYEMKNEILNQLN